MKGLLVIALGTSACFYVDPINQRPALDIVNANSDTIERGAKGIELAAVVNDPEGHIVTLAWRMYVCDDATTLSTCDDAPLGGEGNTFTFDAPIARVDGTPAQSLRIELDGIDDLGATARPSQQLIIPLRNGQPTIVLADASKYGKAVLTPVDVFAVYGDADDTAEGVQLEYVLHPPSASLVQATALCPLLPGGQCPEPADDTKKQDGIRFIPDVTGEWQVEVIGTDPLGRAGDPDGGLTTELITILVVEDQLPCLGVVSPAAPQGTNQLPIGEPTLFQVHNVIDAIDPYPSDLGDDVLGQSSFHWSIKLNAGARQALPTETGNSIAFDPASFAPGDLVELRVEIADRQSPFPLTCDPADATCQLDPTLVPACLQRQTWKVVVQ